MSQPRTIYQDERPAVRRQPPGDRSYNASGDCRALTGATCAGYGPQGTSERQQTTQRQTAPSGGGSPGGACEPGYSPCLPRVSDLNCDEIPADKKPVRVTGSDPCRLDAAHNGTGCQSG